MDDVIVKAVERVIRAMQDNLGEPITIDDMARTAMFSKFHFSRMFQRVTGISPGRFLSALRLQEAKRLLLSSDLTVADISHLVGYNSIGTFSSRFRMSVGVSPTAYRHFGGFVAPLDERRPHLRPCRGDTPTIRGRVHHLPHLRPGRIVVGLFPDRIAQGMPIRHTVAPSGGDFVLTDVPDGSWHLIAQSVALDTDDGPVDRVCVATFGPIQVPAGNPRSHVDLWLRPRRIFDPPALLAQLDQSMWTEEAQLMAEEQEANLRGA
jgi:AraC family transcriptional regulator